MNKLLIIFLLLSVLSPWGYCGVYDLDYLKQDKEAEAKSQLGSFIKLRFKEVPESSLPIFLYRIEKVTHPHKVTDKVFEESVFLVEKGNNFFSQKNYEKALEVYAQALTINPSSVLCLHNMGISYLLLGKYKQSIMKFEEILSLQPLNGYAHFYLGLNYKRLENFARAESYLDSAKEIFKYEHDSILAGYAQALLDGLKVPPQK